MKTAPTTRVYRQVTTGVLHKHARCSITSRTRYDHEPMELPEGQLLLVSRDLCHKCWGSNPQPQIART
jgi:hypothetical protein